MRIDAIKFRNGDNFQCDNINLAIGANNSGKTTFIRELSNCIHDCLFEDLRWIEDIDVSFNKPFKKIFKEIFDHIEIIENNPNIINNLISSNKVNLLDFLPYRNNIINNLGSYNLPYIIQSSLYKDANGMNMTLSKETDKNSPNYYAEKFLSHICVANEFCAGRLQQEDFSFTVNNILSDRLDSPIRQLYERPDLLEKINNEIKIVFNFNIGFDNIQQGQKQLRVIPKEILKTKNQVELAKWWKDNSLIIRDQGDGIKAYLKIILSVLDDFNKVIFIDEPETFLHPPQRQSLGKLIADIASKDKQIFISTHDPVFVRSLLNSSKNIKTIHLSVGNGAHLIQEVPIQDITSEMNKHGNKEKALMYNERILNSFFYKKTILVEDETDRLFYEYYSSLYHSNEFQDCNFIGFNGVDQTVEIMNRLYDFGIDVRCIVDIDFLINKCGPKFIGDLDSSLQLKHAELRRKYKAMSDMDKKSLKDGLQKQGVSFLGQDDRVLYEDVIEGYRKYKVYVVPVGVVESWFKGAKHGNLSQMIKKVQDNNPRKLSVFMKDVLK